MKKGREGGGKNDPKEIARSDFLKEIDVKKADAAKSLWEEFGRSVSEGDIKEYLSSPLSLSHEVDRESLYHFLTFADSIFYTGADEHGFAPALDKYLSVNTHEQESLWLDSYGYDQVLLESELPRFRSIVLASCTRMARKNFQYYLKEQFLYAATCIIPEIPKEMLIRLSPEHREALLKASKIGSEISNTVLDRLSRTTQERIKKLQDDRLEKVKEMVNSGIDPRFAERYMKNSQINPSDTPDVSSVMAVYPNTDDLLFDILGTRFSILVNSFYQSKGQ